MHVLSPGRVGLSVSDHFTTNSEISGYTDIALARAAEVLARRAVLHKFFSERGALVMSTADNLKKAFAGESQANRKYLAFAQKAESDGYPQVARLFRAAAEAETVHAHAHLRALGGIKDTAANLEAAIEGEGFEFQEMYPKFLKEAEAEGNKPAVFSIRNALVVEEVHHGLYGKALESVKSGSDLPASKIVVCSVCGNTIEDEPPEVCPVCGVPGERYFEVA